MFIFRNILNITSAMMPLLAGITFVDYIQVSWGEKEKFEGTNGVIRSRK
jgi:hypothetical protein